MGRLSAIVLLSITLLAGAAVAALGADSGAWLDPVGLLPPPGADDSGVFRRIRLMIQAGNLEEARRQLEPLLTERHTQIEAAALAGWIELRQGNAVAAVRLLRRAERAAPSPAVSKLLAVAYYFERQHRLFESKMREVIKATPDDFAPFYFLGRFYQVDVADLARAEQQFRAAVERNPAHYLSHYHLGFCLESRGAIREAETHYREALHASRAAGVLTPLPYVGLAGVRLLEGKLEEALRLAETAVKIGGRDPRPHRVVASVLSGLGRHREAAAALERAVAADPTDAASWYRLFLAHRAAGNSHGAQQALVRFRQVSSAYEN